MGVEAVFNHADYRLMSRRAIDCAAASSREVNLFLRGIIPQLGFRARSSTTTAQERFAGESKYPLRKMLAFAWQGVTSFSAVPLRLITGIGVWCRSGASPSRLWALWIRCSADDAVPGWASTVLPIYFLGGIQLLCIGIIGEYLAKIYMETKARPRYVIEKDRGGGAALAGRDRRVEPSPVERTGNRRVTRRGSWDPCARGRASIPPSAPPRPAATRWPPPAPPQDAVLGFEQIGGRGESPVRAARMTPERHVARHGRRRRSRRTSRCRRA